MNTRRRASVMSSGSAWEWRALDQSAPRVEKLTSFKKCMDDERKYTTEYGRQLLGERWKVPWNRKPWFGRSFRRRVLDEGKIIGPKPLKNPLWVEWSSRFVGWMTNIWLHVPFPSCFQYIVAPPTTINVVNHLRKEFIIENYIKNKLCIEK